MKQHHNHQTAILRRRQHILAREAMRSQEEIDQEAVNKVALGIYAEYTPRLESAAGNVDALKAVIKEATDAVWDAVEAAGFDPEKFGFRRVPEC